MGFSFVHTISISLVAALLLVLPVQAQQDKALDLCDNAMTIFVSEAGCVPVFNEQRILEGDGQYMSFYQEEGEKSMWYKLIIDTDCRITFNLFPYSPVSGYGFFVYKLYGRSEFCEQIVDKSVDPVRTNLYRNNMGVNGIGLAENPRGNFADSIFASSTQALYYTSYHPAIQARANEVFYINVYRVRGEDCGHQLEFSADGNQTIFRTINLSCYDPTSMPNVPLLVGADLQEKASLRIETIEEIEREARKRELELLQKEVVKRYHLLRFTVIDSVTGKRLKPELSLKHVGSGKPEIISPRSDEKYSIQLIEGENYRFGYSAVGYTKEVVTLSLNESAETEFTLNPLTKGDRFVLKNIYFLPNSYEIKKESEATLTKLLEFLQNNPEMKIEIQGHTNGKATIKKDKTNPKAFYGNEKQLSKLRAEEIKKHLTTFGIQDKRIKTKGMGDKVMLYKDPNNSWEADKNKRVEVYLR